MKRLLVVSLCRKYFFSNEAATKDKSTVRHSSKNMIQNITSINDMTLSNKQEITDFFFIVLLQNLNQLLIIDRFAPSILTRYLGIIRKDSPMLGRGHCSTEKKSGRRLDNHPHFGLLV